MAFGVAHIARKNAMEDVATTPRHESIVAQKSQSKVGTVLKFCVVFEFVWLGEAKNTATWAVIGIKIKVQNRDCFENVQLLLSSSG